MNNEKINYFLYGMWGGMGFMFLLVLLIKWGTN